MSHLLNLKVVQLKISRKSRVNLSNIIIQIVAISRALLNTLTICSAFIPRQWNGRCRVQQCLWCCSPAPEAPATCVHVELSRQADPHLSCWGLNSEITFIHLANLRSLCFENLLVRLNDDLMMGGLTLVFCFHSLCPPVQVKQPSAAVSHSLLAIFFSGMINWRTPTLFKVQHEALVFLFFFSTKLSLNCKHRVWKQPAATWESRWIIIHILKWSNTVPNMLMVQQPDVHIDTLFAAAEFHMLAYQEQCRCACAFNQLDNSCFFFVCFFAWSECDDAKSHPWTTSCLMATANCRICLHQTPRTISELSGCQDAPCVPEEPKSLVVKPGASADCLVCVCGVCVQAPPNTAG